MAKIKIKSSLLHEGRTKILYHSTEPGALIQHFKDDIVIDEETSEKFSGKGILNNRISESIMLRLSDIGIQNHFIRTINMREQLIKEVEMIPIKVVIRNVASGSFSSRLAIEEGIVLPHPILEFYLKSRIRNEAIVNEDHIVAFGWADKFELEEIRAYSMRINDYLSGLFNGIGIRLVDFKLEFGRYIKDNIETIILADEITPDTCRLWDLHTNETLDKERLKKDLGDVLNSYKEISKRLSFMNKNSK